MRKFLLFILLVATHCAVRGQAGYELLYWFDEEKKVASTSSLTGEYSIDVSHLESGMHLLHLVVKDSTGLQSRPMARTFLKVPRVNTMLTYLYWFNENEKEKKIVQSSSSSFSDGIDVSTLADGLQQLNVQVADAYGRFSTPETRSFLKVPLLNKMLTYLYWFNENEKEKKIVQSSSSSFSDSIDVSALNRGFHQLNVQVADAYGRFSQPSARQFFNAATARQDIELLYWFDEDTTNINTCKTTGEIMWLDVKSLSDGFHTLNIQARHYTISQAVSYDFIKIPQTQGIEEMTCVVFVDDSLYCKQKLKPTDVGILNLNLDVSSLRQGIHMLEAYVVTPTGAATTTSNHVFIRSAMDSELANLKCYYTIDGNKNSMQAGIYNNGTYHFDLDVASLDVGIHELSYILVGDNGVSTEARSALFYKAPTEKNGIIQYEYWINDNDSVRNITRLKEKVDPLKLISLLPVESVPLRSSSFHFEVKEGMPMMYAKNRLNMRFYDSLLRFTDFSRDYVDYNISQEVADITPIAKNENSITFVAPDSNRVKWFSIEAGEGDTIALRSNQAVSMQLFSPTGEELYSANGHESTQMNGCHTWSNGTHYLAVHDLKGSKPNITLDIIHWDKYDIVSQDVTTVGDGGASTITYKGNGLKNLCEVKYINSANDTIKADYIIRTSDSEVGIIADFNMAARGDYDALFIFSGYEYKKVYNSVTVEEATDINLKTKVSFASNYLLGTSTTYDISVTNEGNMTAHYVPLELKLITESIDNIIDLKVGGELRSINAFENFEYLDFADEEQKESLREILNSVNDLSQFFVVKDTVKGVDCANSIFIISIPPNTTSHYSVTINSTKTFELYAYTSRNWFPVTGKEISIEGKQRINSRSRETLCCYRERVQCFADIIGYIPKLPGGCAVDFAITGLNTAYDVWCSEGNNVSERWKNYIETNKSSVLNNVIQTAISCVIGFYAKRYDELYAQRKNAAAELDGDAVREINKEIAACRKIEEGVLRGIYENAKAVLTSSNCYKAFTEKKPNCPPDPDGGGGKSTPVTSFDPNDIVGFTAESGSRYVPNSFDNAHYTIRCENDPEFATASAHTVVIVDPLDGSKLDLKSFEAQSVKVGDVTMELNGEKTFVKTMDLRPAIDVVAEVTLNYDDITGIVVLTIKSLDPMTMEPTNDPMQGVLPVNNGGNGEAEFSYKIKLKDALVDGTEIDNKAYVIFDNQEAIVTPIWRNYIDNVKPVSSIIGIEEVNDSVIQIDWEGSDVGSGVWKYDLYVQPGSNAEWIKFSCDTLRTSASLTYMDEVSMGFCVLAVDSAGNVEDKELVSEAIFMRSAKRGDVNRDSVVSMGDVVAVIGYLLENPPACFSLQGADVNGDNQVTIGDVVGIINIVLNIDDYVVKYVKRNNRVTLPHEYLRINSILCNEEDSVVTIPLELFNDNDYSAFQMDVELPDGVKLVSASLSERSARSHNVTCEKLSDGKIRVVAYSFDNETFAGCAGEILKMHLDAGTVVGGKVSVCNIRMAQPDGNETLLEDCNSLIDINGLTGINHVADGRIKVYTVNGVLVVDASKSMQVAVYSANGSLVEMLSLVKGKNVCSNIPAGTYVVGGVTVVVGPQTK